MSVPWRPANVVAWGSRGQRLSADTFVLSRLLSGWQPNIPPDAFEILGASSRCRWTSGSRERIARGADGEGTAKRVGRWRATDARRGSDDRGRVDSCAKHTLAHTLAALPTDQRRTRHRASQHTDAGGSSARSSGRRRSSRRARPVNLRAPDRSGEEGTQKIQCALLARQHWTTVNWPNHFAAFLDEVSVSIQLRFCTSQTVRA